MAGPRPSTFNLNSLARPNETDIPLFLILSEERCDRYIERHSKTPEGIKRRRRQAVLNL